jgi:hypothetical protein
VKERTMMTCPRCGNPAILMASEEFKLLDCEFCDDVIDVSDQELSEPEPAPVCARRLRVVALAGPTDGRLPLQPAARSRR